MRMSSLIESHKYSSKFIIRKVVVLRTKLILVWPLIFQRSAKNKNKHIGFSVISLKKVDIIKIY